MIELLIFKKDWRGFTTKDIITFMPGVNLLVGDQGCGKSTILQCIAEHGKIERPFWKRDGHEIRENTILVSSGRKRVFAHDFENDSPRTAPSLDTMGHIPLASGIAFMRMSHGESTNSIINAIGEMKDYFIILDEPDMSLSPRSALKLVDAFKEAAKNGCQIIASVHNPWVIERFDRVCSIEHRRWMTPKEFLLYQTDAELPKARKVKEKKHDAISCSLFYFVDCCNHS